METLREVLDPHFIMRNSVWLGVLVGLVCPLVGGYLVLRRLVFLGVALPQVSSCGIACAFAFHAWGLIPHLEQGEHGLAMSGSVVLTLLTLALLTLAERRGRGFLDGRLGTAYVLAGAWSILLLVKNPYGEHGLLERLRGEIVTVSDTDLGFATITLVVIAGLLLLFRKELLLVSFDREMAITLGKNVLLWDALLYLLIGLTVSVSVLSVGPLVTFGFFVLPPFIAHETAGSMLQTGLIASGLGATAALAGFCIAYRWDLPVGPTDVALLGVLYGIVWLGAMLMRRRPR